MASNMCDPAGGFPAGADGAVSGSSLRRADIEAVGLLDFPDMFDERMNG